MRYEAKDCETGELVEIELPAAQAPGIGTIFVHSGRKYERLVSFPAIRVAHGVDRTGACKAYSLPRKGAPFWNDIPEAPHYDTDGFAVFRTERERERWLARGAGDKVTYDKNGSPWETSRDSYDGPGKAKKRRRSKNG